MVIAVTLTELDMVPNGFPQRGAPHARWYTWPLLVVGILAIAAPLVTSLVPAKLVADRTRCVERDSSGTCARTRTEAAEFALVPALAEPVEPRLSISGVTTYPSSKQIFFVTIREPAITMFDWLFLRDNPASRFMTHTEKYGDQTEQQLIQAGQRQMTGAKDRATYVALKEAGLDVARQEGPAVIDYIVCIEESTDHKRCVTTAPAGKVLQPDDQITSLNGHVVKVLSDVTAALDGVKPGDTVKVEFTRDGKAMSGSIQVIQAPGEKEARTIVGFMPIDTTTVKLPKGLKVDIGTEGIGGPSAGTAFTLTLIDALTKGNLMGPHNVAVTGEIDIDGKVGAIGGLNSKAAAVLQAGVKYFLVPASQPESGPDSVAAAREAVHGKVTIIPIATIGDALAALRQLGGDPIPGRK
jgi:PDZ domain-containing protein